MKNLLHSALILLLLSKGISVKCQDALSITRQMFATVKSTKTLQYSFDSKERIKGKIYHEVSDFKINTNPFQVYVYQHVPKKGIEVLYLANTNSGKAKVNPNAFPWVNVNLDPEGSMMMANHHHSLYDGGFAYTSSIIEYLLNKYSAQSSKLIVNNGIYKVEGTDCYYFIFTNPNYKIMSYTVGENETVLSIARKFKINYYSIWENNPDVDDFDVIKAGTKLQIPNDYASRMELYIHKTKLYPVYIKIYDNKGLYEEYTFSNMILNPTFTNNTFSAENPEYHF